ncbi:M56 family metallopeptidase [Pedobacter frigoris]|uniref:TonB family protein n=1 Tax=Pedobacter frigoris TaxID=2571272 RepID=A0A4U1CQB2_9SPHI|nr:M56 family metallopeptidase [Pedobacter frigoris]TKC07624.1 TonB family protein [Pedobacter frigoris]
MSWAHYILQVNIYLVIFYGFYKLLLDKETYFILNRIYLVSAGVFSLIIPFIRFEWFTQQQVVQPVYVGVDQLNQLVTQIAVTPETPTSFSLGNFVVLIYIAGVLFFITKFIYQLLSIRLALKQKKSGLAFSFFKYKVVDNELPNSNTIDRHEEIHVRQLHTLDVLFFEILGAITWFNPIIYFYKNTIKNIHEYLADEEAARFQGDKEEYALLLLSSAFGISPNSLTNSFYNKSLIKRRIFMLHKQRSAKTAVLKYGLFVPLFALTLVLSSATVRSNEQILQIADQIPLEEPLSLAKETITDVIIMPVKEIVMPKTSFKSIQTSTIIPAVAETIADWEDFYKYMQMNLRYPAQALQNEMQGKCQVKFAIENGEIEGLALASKTLGSGVDAEVITRILSYKNFKNVSNGKYTFIASFTLQGAKSTVLNENIAAIEGYNSLSEVVVSAFAGDKTVRTGNLSQVVITGTASDDDKVYDFTTLEKNPSYPGGIEKFYQYVQRTVKYPQEAQNNKVQGKVLLSFIVEKDGSLTNIKVDRKLGWGTDEEAMRVIKNSIKWIPGVAGGKIVRVKYNIPISFTLDMGSNKTGLLKDQILIRENIKGQTIGSATANLSKNMLYVVDGKKMETEKAGLVKTQDIETISILKSSDAIALYGDAGKDGVIIITTKTGKDSKDKN